MHFQAAVFLLGAWVAHGISLRRAMEPKVVVIVRTYAPQTQAFLEMMGNLSVQPIEGCSSECVSFLLLPTEQGDLNHFRQLVEDTQGQYDVIIPPWLDDNFFDNTRAIAPHCTPPLTTGPEFVNDLCGPYRYMDKNCDAMVAMGPEYEADLLRTVCMYENYLHYSLVDAAIEYSIERFTSEATYVLVTNGDNVYNATFLPDLTRLMNQSGYDLIACDFHERGFGPIDVRWELGRIDLGAALVRLSCLKNRNVRFLNSAEMPVDNHNNVASMRALHDADYWYFHRLTAIENVSRFIHHEVLFTHT